MRKRLRQRTDYEHCEAALMNARVEHEGRSDWTVIGLQSGTATITRPDGFQRHKPIHEIKAQLPARKGK